ncbi:MAG: hypothetical protein JXR73_03220 [Candidatus Omnitrophica bacterium]|nr:hypothetical protein [Candidatus Omnitrophota bacterium]
MKKQILVILSMLSLLGLAASAQQNVTIKPGDDVNAIIASVVDPGSTITFEAGYYLVTRNEDGDPTDFIRMPEETTIRGAGSGLDPSTATIIDCGYTYDSAFKIDDGVYGVTVENITAMRTYDSVIEIDAGAFENTFNNVWCLHSGEASVEINAEAEFNFCVFAYPKGDNISADDSALGYFTNCDIALSQGDIIETDGSAEIILRNCIVFAALGGNDVQQDAGFIGAFASVGWDVTPGTDPIFGGLDVAGGALIDITSIAADPMYVKAPGMGFKASEMDIHLQEGSPALTAGSTSFDDNDNPTGDPTFAGSQGPAPVNVSSWSLY